MGSVPFLVNFSTVQFCFSRYKIHVFLWSIYRGNLLGTNSPASGMTSIRLEEKQRSFFPYQLRTVDDQIWI